MKTPNSTVVRFVIGLPSLSTSPIPPPTLKKRKEEISLLAKHVNYETGFKCVSQTNTGKGQVLSRPVVSEASSYLHDTLLAPLPGPGLSGIREDYQAQFPLNSSPSAQTSPEPVSWSRMWSDHLAQSGQLLP